MAKKYNRSKATLYVGYDEGGMDGIIAKIDIENNISVEVKYDVPLEPFPDDAYDYEEMEAYYRRVEKEYNKTVNANEVESILGTSAVQCRIIRNDVDYLY